MFTRLKRLRRSAINPGFIKLDARLLRLVWVLAAAGSVAVLVIGTVAALGQRFELRAAAIRLQAIAPTAKMQAVVAPTASPGFTLALPPAAPMDRILGETFRSAARAGLTVLSAEPRDAHRASSSELTSTTLDLKVSGPYPAIKDLVSELLGRFPGLTLQHMRVNRAGGVPGRRDTVPLSTAQAIEAPVQEAVLTLRQWSRPAALSAAAVKTRE